MSLEFLAFANLTLLVRGWSLFRDDAASGRVWRVKTGLEIIGLAVLYPFSRVWLAAAGTVVVVNLLGFWLEKRGRRKEFMRLALGLLGLALFSLWVSPRFGLAFRPELGRLAAQLADWTVLAPWLQALLGRPAQLFLFGLLVVANEANLVIRAVFDSLDLKPRLKPGAGGVVDVDVGEFNRGRVIGVLERVLLYSFVLQGQYGAIGFILAAKAFTRFKALDDRPFAEYVLIGTLLSACLALATGGAVLWLLRH
jgi:hypothetical protein